MSKAKEELYKNELHNLEFAYIVTTAQALWDQEYGPCLELLLDKEITLDHTFRISTCGAKWYIDCSGMFAWGISFIVNEGVVSDIFIRHTYCKRNQIRQSLQDLVLHILTTYHPDGKEIEFSPDEALIS